MLFRSFILDYYYFTVSGVPEIIGYVHKSIIDRVSWSESWIVDPKYRTLHLKLSPDDPYPFGGRTELVYDTVEKAQGEGNIKEMARRGKDVTVYTPAGEAAFDMNAVGVEMFGNVAFAVQLIAWTMLPEGKLYWLQRRAATKAVYPRKLDTAAGGSLRAGEKKFDTMTRKAKEEANIPLELSTLHMKARGSVSFHTSHSFLGNPGSYPHVLYAYEMELPEGFAPKPNNGEVDEFIAMTESQIMDSLYTDVFKPALVMLWIDHFYRHGIIDADNEPYLQEICSSVHRKQVLH